MRHEDKAVPCEMEPPRTPTGATASIPVVLASPLSTSARTARYETPPEVAAATATAVAAANKMPPLKEDQYSGLGRRLGEVFTNIHLGDSDRTFDPAGFVAAVNAHLETTGLRPESGREYEPGVNVVQVNNCPPWERMAFVVDPATFVPGGTPTGHSMSTQAQLTQFLASQHVQVRFTNHAPGAVVSGFKAGPWPNQPADAAAGQNVPRPVEVFVPPGLPAACKKRDAPKAVDQVLNWFEVCPAASLPCH